LGDWLKRHISGAGTVLSVCNGAEVLRLTTQRSLGVRLLRVRYESQRVIIGNDFDGSVADGDIG
jgi:hypothetical protein